MKYTMTRPPIAIKAFFWGFVLVLFSAVTMTCNAQSSVRPPDNTASIAVPNPAPELWRAVRQRESLRQETMLPRAVPAQELVLDLWAEVQSGQAPIAGRTQVAGVDAGVLINPRGEQWRNFRMAQLLPFAAYLLAGVLLLATLYFALRGCIRISGGRSGILIRRFSLSQRTLHWIVAITFVILALTGLILLFGRSTLIPLIGARAFSYIALGAKRLHDFVGPVFGIALALQFFFFIRGNLPHPRDIKWLLKGGGLFGGHASAHRYNAGEKGWFWIAMLGGLLVVASGLVLDFPMFGLDRAAMELTHVIHSTGAVILLAVSLGHIYMGTIGTEGTFEVMKTGYCDANWAREHHDLWYEDLRKQGKIGVVEENEDPALNKGRLAGNG